MQPGTFLDGVFYVPLERVVDADVMVVRIAAGVGFSFHGTHPIQTQLSSYLADKEILLILDNMEQLLDEESTAVADIQSWVNKQTIDTMTTSILA